MTSQQPSTRVWTNGSVYSPADPFATALLVSGSTVAWVGSDDAARAMAGPDARAGDLRAAVVTPAFVAHCRVPGAGEQPAGATARDLPRVSQGYGAVELLGPDADTLAEAASRVASDGAVALPVLVRPADAGTEIDPAALPSPALGLDAAADPGGRPLQDAAREHLEACTRAGIQAVLVLPSSEPVVGGREPSDAPSAAEGSAAASATEALLTAAEGAAASTGQRAFRARGHRLLGVGDLSDEQCARLAGLGLTVSCRAGEAPLRELARAGVPVTLMTDGENPWAAVKLALEAPHERLRTSARAAFLALTRGAWRAHPGGAPLAGQLAPGAEATLAVWDAESVMVQQAQGTGASWSTDPRARTPVLPALDDDRLPRCEATMVAGQLVSGTEPQP